MPPGTTFSAPNYFFVYLHIVHGTRYTTYNFIKAIFLFILLRAPRLKVVTPFDPFQFIALQVHRMVYDPFVTTYVALNVIYTYIYIYIYINIYVYIYIYI